MSDPDDFVLEVTPELLLKAYASGIFPMAESADDPGLFWVEPELRGVIPLDDFHVPRRLARTVRQNKFQVSADTCFERVIQACAEATNSRENTWISSKIVELYCELHAMNHAHSLECWLDGELVGGLYGVSLRGAFFGESMFSRVRDASKVALVHLVSRLKVGGYSLLDAQFITAHLSQFGAEEIDRKIYEARLGFAMSHTADFHAAEGKDLNPAAVGG